MMDGMPKPSFQFGLRGALFLVALCAVLLGWWADHRRLVQDRDAKLKMAMTKTVLAEKELREVLGEMVGLQQKIRQLENPPSEQGPSQQ